MSRISILVAVVAAVGLGGLFVQIEAEQLRWDATDQQLEAALLLAESSSSATKSGCQEKYIQDNNLGTWSHNSCDGAPRGPC